VYALDPKEAGGRKAIPQASDREPLQ
jgi:hypothetical protein